MEQNEELSINDKTISLFDQEVGEIKFCVDEILEQINSEEYHIAEDEDKVYNILASSVMFDGKELVLKGHPSQIVETDPKITLLGRHSKYSRYRFQIKVERKGKKTEYFKKDSFEMQRIIRNIGYGVLYYVEEIEKTCLTFGMNIKQVYLLRDTDPFLSSLQGVTNFVREF